MQNSTLRRIFYSCVFFEHRAVIAWRGVESLEEPRDQPVEMLLIETKSANMRSSAGLNRGVAGHAVALWRMGTALRRIAFLLERPPALPAP